MVQLPFNCDNVVIFAYFNNLFINLVIETRASNPSASEFGSFSLEPTEKNLSVAYACFFAIKFSHWYDYTINVLVFQTLPCTRLILSPSIASSILLLTPPTFIQHYRWLTTFILFSSTNLRVATLRLPFARNWTGFSKISFEYAHWNITC